MDGGRMQRVAAPQTPHCKATSQVTKGITKPRLVSVSASGVRGSNFFGNDHLNATNCSKVGLSLRRGL
eukprot:scaffold8780_cov130-Isochrysis_galbana.AAC.2